MSDVRVLRRSFAGGEITPELYARLDLTRHQTGLALCRNFVVLPHGPVANRAGTGYVLETKFSARRSRLIPFTYNNAETYILEFGHQYVRFHTLGATVVEASQAIVSVTQAGPGVFEVTGHGYSVGQWVYLAALAGMTVLNGRFYKIATAPTVDTFTLATLDDVALSTASLLAYTGSGTVARVYEVTTPYDESAVDLLAIHYAQSNDVLTLVHPSYAQREMRRISAASWTIGTLSVDPTIAAPAGVGAAATVGVGTESYTYAVTTVDEDGNESLISSSASCTNKLWEAGNKNTVTWGAVTGAKRYNVYRSRGGLMSFIGQAKTTSFEDNNIAPDTLTTPPEAENPFGAAGDYPTAVTYFEQRRVFGGTTNRPQNMYLTRSGTESDMSSSLPTRDDDAIAFRIASREANAIRHLVPLNDLVVLTASAAWRITSVNSDAVTPATISVRPTAYIGASLVQPIVTGNSVLYGEARGGRLAELRYSWELSSYEVVDASLMAPHLFDGYTLTDLTYAAAPYRIAWAVRSDGTLLGCTYVPQHEVLGWHQHDTDGDFEACAAVVEGNEDALYLVVRRTLNGRTVRYVERMASRRQASLTYAWHVDCGQRYEGAAATEISGLEHLEGETVAILADGAVHPPRVVTDGKVTLEQAASVVLVGLPITADLQTLPLYAQVDPAFGEGVAKNVAKVTLRLHESSGVFTGPSFTRLRPFKQRTSEPYGSPPALFTGLAEVQADGLWQDDGQVCVRQSDPLPVTVVSIALDVALGE